MARTLAETYAAGTTLPFHTHDWHQLVFASSGVLAVDAGDGVARTQRWIVPPERAVWMPAAQSHRLVARTRASLRTVYVAPGVPGTRRDIAVVRVSPLLRALIMRAVETGMLRRDRPEHVRLTRVMLDELRDVEAAPLRVTQPRDPIANAAALALADDPGQSLDAVARTVGVGRRTLERRFADDVSTSLGRWRRQVRLARALELLAEGQSVTDAGANVGYATTSAFIDAFRREFGCPPTRYLQPDGSGGA